MAVLYRQYHRRLLSYARRLLGDRERAEDVMQDVWERVLRLWPEGSPIPENPAGLLLTIVRNQCIDTLRRKSYHKPLSIVAEKDLPAIEIPEPTRREELLLLGLSQLKPSQRDVLMLYMSGYSVEAIAQISGRPVGAVKSLAWRARVRLREILEAMLERENAIMKLGGRAGRAS